MNQPIRILLQTTVPNSEHDWDIKRFKQEIEQPLIKIFGVAESRYELSDSPSP